MTAQPTNPHANGDRVISLLEAILEKVETVDETVDAILDRLGEYVDHARYGTTWPSSDDNGETWH